MVMRTTMHVGLLGTMAQLYLSDLKEKTRRGQLGRALAGKIPGWESLWLPIGRRRTWREEGN